MSPVMHPMAPPTTPGPWTADGHIIRDADGQPIAVLLASLRPTEEWEGNRHLIAGAPVMRNALEACHQLLGGWHIAQGLEAGARPLSANDIERLLNTILGAIAVADGLAK